MEAVLGINNDVSYSLSACTESIDTCIEGSKYSKAQLKTLKDALIMKLIE